MNSDDFVAKVVERGFSRTNQLSEARVNNDICKIGQRLLFAKNPRLAQIGFYSPLDV